MSTSELNLNDENNGLEYMTPFDYTFFSDVIEIQTK